MDEVAEVPAVREDAPTGVAASAAESAIEPMTLCQFVGAAGALVLALPAVIGA